MIPVRLTYVPRKPRPYLVCVHCGIRLADRHRSRKKCCVDCEARVRAAVWAARYAVRAAIARGELVHASTLTCVDCGLPAVCYDHRDYGKPLLVVPVCKSCNNIRGPGLLREPS